MNEALQSVRNWFAGLAPRERWLVLAAAAVAIFAIVFAGGIQPLRAARTRAADEVAARRALLADIEGVAGRYGPQVARPAGGAVAGADSLVVVVDRSTRERGLAPYLKRNQPDGPASIRLRIENAPFDLVLEWLGELQAREGLRATAASFDPAGEPGRINSNLVLARTGS
jgi:general secretion pathway protein M